MEALQFDFFSVSTAILWQSCSHDHLTQLLVCM